MKDKYKLKEELTRYRGRICAAKMQYDRDCKTAMLTYNNRFVDRACCDWYKCPFYFDDKCFKHYHDGGTFQKQVR